MPTFRGFPACDCLVAWLPVYEAELQRRGQLAGDLPIFQLIGNAPASGGVHADGGAFDVSDLTGDADVWVARQMGADATWARTKAQGFTPHLHGVLRGCPHNWPARYQIDAVDDGFNGLGQNGHGGPDDGPRPLSKRTWREGIAWANEQGDDMAKYREWEQADKDALAGDVARSILDSQTVELKKRDGTTKPITLRAAVQRILNSDE